ncbi:hypothetical protein ZYGR_0AD06880 [Zygosaccharomyces rouxii]|uniref:Major facilitator superfamily (MFS) profile domain-containing protein n=1 Tax=Zygosaccharomyces rouxii TaxID=4956 RepID=A0A1Q3A6Z6_ZYGRO|nr:hypothetical protein ZYGR_0AD06880 [Zygosaccharomyces rouxii]
MSTDQETVQNIELTSFDKSGAKVSSQYPLDEESYPYEGEIEVGVAEEEDLEEDLRDSNFSWVLTSIWTNSALAALDGTIVSTTVNDIASQFQQASMVTWVATAYLLTTTAVQPLYGKISDIIGRRKCLLFGEVIFALGVLLCNFANTIPQLAIARAICGIGGSGNSAMGNIMLNDILPLSVRATYWSYGAILASIFQSLGGPIGGLLLKWFGVGGLFTPQIPFCIGSIYLSYKYIHDYKEHARNSWKRIDFGGSICLLVGISSFIFFFSASDNTTIEDDGWSTPKKWSVVLLIVSIIAFAFIENFVAVECIIPRVILEGTLGLMVCIHGLVAVINYTCLFMVPLFLQLNWGVSVSRSGGYIMFIVIFSSAGSLFTSMILNRFSKPTRSSQLFCAASAIFYMSILTIVGYYYMQKAIYYSKPIYGSDTQIPKYDNWSIILGIAILGFCQGSQNVTISIYNVAKVGRKEQASSTSVNLLFRSMGNVLSVSIALNIFTNVLKKKLSIVLNDDLDLLAVLLKDNAFLRSDIMPTERIGPILGAFHDALGTSIVPCKWCVYISLILSLMLFVTEYRQHKDL